MKNRKTPKGIFFVAVLLVLLVSLILFFSLIEKAINRMNEMPDSLDYTDSGNSQIFYNDHWYSLNKNVESILVLGIDSMITPDGSKADSHQADFIALVVIDKLNHSFRVLHINRDTMTEISQINDAGEKYGTFTAQLALAHVYGSDGKMRCRNTVSAIENLLYGINIDHYFSLTMDVVPIINDSLGGITVTLEDDIPALGEKFVKGAEITLSGDEALSFVRYRSNEAEQSNLGRMERQRQYISALFDKFTTTEVEDSLETISDIDEYIVSDCTVNQLTLLMERLQDYTHKGTFSLEGEAVKGSEYIEYYIDETAAQTTVVDLFYKIEE